MGSPATDSCTFNVGLEIDNFMGCLYFVVFSFPSDFISNFPAMPLAVSGICLLPKWTTGPVARRRRIAVLRIGGREPGFTSSVVACPLCSWVPGHDRARSGGIEGPRVSRLWGGHHQDINPVTSAPATATSSIMRSTVFSIATRPACSGLTHVHALRSRDEDRMNRTFLGARTGRPSPLQPPRTTGMGRRRASVAIHCTLNLSSWKLSRISRFEAVVFLSFLVFWVSIYRRGCPAMCSSCTELAVVGHSPPDR